MKVAVFGPRNFGNEEAVKTVWERLKLRLGEHLTLLHGGAKGPQSVIVELESNNKDTDIVLFKPWHMVSKKIEFQYNLFFNRNKQIVDNSDVVIVFREFRNPEDETDSEIRIVSNYLDTRQKNKPVIFFYKGEEGGVVMEEDIEV